MHSLLIDREGRARKLWIGEDANRDDDCAIEAFERVVDRCPTFRTEPEGALGPLISNANKLLAFPEIVTALEENRACAPKALPVRRWRQGSDIPRHGLGR